MRNIQLYKDTKKIDRPIPQDFSDSYSSTSSVNSDTENLVMPQIEDSYTDMQQELSAVSEKKLRTIQDGTRNNSDMTETDKQKTGKSMTIIHEEELEESLQPNRFGATCASGPERSQHIISQKDNLSTEVVQDKSRILPKRESIVKHYEMNDNNMLNCSSSSNEFLMDMLNNNMNRIELKQKFNSDAKLPIMGG